MSDVNRKWFYLFILSLIWGTSYILIKKALDGFNPVQLGAIRILITAILLFIIGLRSLRSVTREEWRWIAISGFLGSFFPVFLFAYAQTEIDSGVASILNSLVPLFTILVGYFLFKIAFNRNQLLGVLVGLTGAILLIILGSEFNPDQNYLYAILVILATVGYAFNANIIKKKLSEVRPMTIAVGNFAVIVFPAIPILFLSGALDRQVVESEVFFPSLGYLLILAFFGTCIAKIMFNRLIQISTPVFSTSVTYLIPVVGIFWGTLDGEKFNLSQLLSAAIILFGVYLVNKRTALKPSKKMETESGNRS